MMQPTLGQVNAIYSCGRTVSITPQFLSFPALGQFSMVLNEFARELGERIEDPYWSDFIRPLKRFSFDLCAAPWPAASLADYSRERYGAALKHLANCRLMYPSLDGPARALVATLETIAETDYDPILEGLQSIANDLKAAENMGVRVAILIAESRLVKTARQAIATTPDFADWPVLVPRNVRGNVIYDHLVVVGSPAWYRRAKYVFSAPRAPAIHVLCYDWMSVNWRHEPALAAPLKGMYRAQRISYTSSFLGLHDDDVIPLTADIDSVLARAKNEAIGNSEHDMVRAQLLVLEDDKGVFIEAGGNAQVRIIDLNETRDKRLRMVPSSQIERDMYILLRTAGGGDYVVPVADRLLGEHADELREMQQTWKARLRLLVKREGMDETVATLNRHGSRIASYQNIRNWMNDRSIATEDYEEFSAILEPVGLGEEAPEYWKVMKEIRRAHAKAGHLIGKQLLEQVNKSDLAELERVGFMEFALADEDAGSLTAYRIKMVAGQVVEVHSRRIDHTFKLEDM